ARRARDLVDLIARTDGAAETVEALGGFELPAEPQSLARSLSTATQVVSALRGAQWELLDQVGTFADDRDSGIRDALWATARAEELHASLAPALKNATKELIELLRPVTPTPQPTTEPSPQPSS